MRIFDIALQPRKVRDCPYTTQGQIRLPTKLPFLSKIDLTSDLMFFLKTFLQIFENISPKKMRFPLQACHVYLLL